MKKRCKWCNSTNTVKNGMYHSKWRKAQIYYCKDCKREFSFSKIIKKNVKIKKRCKWCNSENTAKVGTAMGKWRKNQKWYCNNCKRTFSFTQLVNPFPCAECGSLIKNAKNTDKIYCDECIHQHEMKATQKWLNKNRIAHNKKQSEYYHKKIFTGRMLGTSRNGSFLNRDYKGKPDFKKEKITIRHLKFSIMNNGNDGLSSNVSIIHDPKGSRVWQDYKKLPHNSRLVLDRSRDIPYPKLCNYCKTGLIILPENPKSYDFDTNGLVMPYCSDCGTVVEW